MSHMVLLIFSNLSQDGKKGTVSVSYITTEAVKLILALDALGRVTVWN